MQKNTNKNLTPSSIIKTIERHKNEINITGLILGRFQPFHLGHYHTVKKALKECDKVIIAIGSARKEGTENNPFSAELREKMIKSCFPKEELKRIKIFKIPDINNNDEYVDHLTSITGHVDIFYGGDNELTKRLFREKGYRVKAFERFKEIKSTDIRKLIKEKKNIKGLVPEGVLRHINY